MAVQNEYLNQYVPHLDRHSSSCTWDQFCERLYQALWRKGGGYYASSDVLHELYASSKICGIVVASQQGFASFEDLLHSSVLDHVVTIEKVPPTETHNFTTYRYLPALNNNFQNVRRHTRQKKSDICITDSSMEEQEGTINCKTEDLEEFFKEENSSSNSSQNGTNKLFENEDSELKGEEKNINKMRKNSEKLKGKNY
uniref:Uncharacterized protein n=1 Tax=Meloidogyne enterolobii TaxID=390850 RepID=A0A6V7TQ67_MELEN|nr:unnamed protein product [Meloidogyne enterolobii]